MHTAERMTAKSKKPEDSFMVILATFIVDRRKLVFIVTLITLAFPVFSRKWVEAERS